VRLVKDIKLVRDLIPRIIEEEGRTCTTRTAHGLDEHLIFLRVKMIEEVNEFIADPSYEEAADMLEVLKAFCSLHGLDFDTVVSTAHSKQETHGGFHRGVILREVIDSEDR